MQSLILRLAFNFICKKNSRALSFTSLVSIIGISFGVAAFLVVMTVLSSFQAEMKHIISAINPNLIIFSTKGIDNVTEFEQQLPSLISAPIISMSPFIYNESIMGLGAEASAVYIRAIQGTKSSSAAELSKYIRPQKALSTLDNASSTLPHAIIGYKLAENLGAKTGDTVTLTTFGVGGQGFHPKYTKLYVTGVINMGLSQYDEQYVLMNFDDGVKLFGTPGWASAVEVKLKNPDDALAVSQDLTNKIPYTPVAWQQIDRGLFEQIERDGIAIKLIVLIISFVAGFNIVVTLSLTVMDRSKQIALLRSIGARQAQIIKVFVCAGTILGVLGSLLGVATGLLILKIFSGLSLGNLQEFYYLEKIPVKIDPQFLLIAFITTILLSFLGALYPAWKATRISPLYGLRNGS